MASKEYPVAKKTKLFSVDRPPNQPQNDPGQEVQNKSQALQLVTEDTIDEERSDDTQATPSNFPKFTALPQEIQDLVWKEAALSVPTLHVVRAKVLCIETGVQRPWMSISPCEEVKQRARRLRDLFLACKKARKEVLRTLPEALRFASYVGAGRGVQLGLLHFDVETDVLCFVPPIQSRFWGPVVPNVGADLRRVQNLGLQLNYAVGSDLISSQLGGGPLSLSMPRDSLVCFGPFIGATRFYLVAPPHIRKAPEIPKLSEADLKKILEETYEDARAGGPDIEGGQVGAGCVPSGPVWSHNPLLQFLQMADSLGSIGTAAGLGPQKAPMQQVQHVYATDSAQDLTPRHLSLLLFVCCRLDTDTIIKQTMFYSHVLYLYHFGSHFADPTTSPPHVMEYCGVLLPMVETYPLLKVYDGPIRRSTMRGWGSGQT